ncbi:MAG TPA: DUF805 domain-containing protein [Psychromonas hadalis]|nr:DUF805 domain-containing protein [Psychromonas hadalis]
MNWYLDAFKKYAVFKGRARRKEYWYFQLGNAVISLVLALIFARGIDGESAANGIYSLIIFIPNLAVSIRRLHDTGRSGWFMLLLLIPIIGWLVLLYFFIQDSQMAVNEYGENPKIPNASKF